MFTPKDMDKATSSGYMKLVEGANKIRIMKEPITGFEYWTDKIGRPVEKNAMAGEGGKPVRVETFDELKMEFRGLVKAFAAMVVWNYAIKKIQILQIKQVGILNALEALSKNEDWGDITGYDIVITKTKTGEEARDVEYSVMPSPAKELTVEVLEAYEDTKIDLQQLYKGEDPFGIETIDLETVK
jgi:hypothetical protein